MGSHQKTPLRVKPLHTLNTLAYTEPQIIHLRDGEVVLFKRQHSQLWKCRFKLSDGSVLQHAVLVLVLTNNNNCSIY